MKAGPVASASAAVVLAGGSALAYRADVPYLPSVLMFAAAIVALGAAASVEDRLLRKYDTPHADDTHPPLLILFRVIRTVVLVIMGILVFVLAS